MASDKVRLIDFTLSGANSRIVGILDAFIKVQNNTLEEFEELLEPYDFDIRKETILKHIRED